MRMGRYKPPMEPNVPQSKRDEVRLGLIKGVLWKDRVLIAFVLVTFFVLNHAGSLAAAGIAALGGLAGLLGHRLPHPRRWPAPIWAGFAFIGFAVLSALWSPYMPQRELSGYMRFGLGVPLYAALVFVMARQATSNQTMARAIILALLPLSACVFAIEFLSGYAITKMADPNALDGNISKNLSHGLSVLFLCLPPVTIMMWRRSVGFKALAIFCALAASACAVSSGNSAAVIAVPFAALIVTLAYFRPKLAVSLVFLTPILALLLAPVLSIITAELSADTKSALPFSWEWRVETWAYLGERIIDHPIIGNGFDSLRAFTDTFSARGFDDLSYIPLHAHNYGLHIWTETGLVGVVLLALCLWLTQQNLRTSSWLTRPRACALTGTVAVAFVFSSLSYSAWQDWWLGAIAIAISFTMLIQAPQKDDAHVTR